MNEATLTFELLTEELPPKALKALGEAFTAAVREGLAARGFLQEATRTTGFATPRRLAITLTRVLARSPDQPVRERLMPASVALDAQGPTKALRKKLAGLGREALADRWPDAVDGADRLFVEHDGKVDAVFLASIAAGVPLARGLDDTLAEAIARLPIPKVMRYAPPSGYYNGIEFVRPAHRLLALHGADVVPVRALGLDAGRVTDGHRFLSRDGLEVATAEAYEETLQAEGKVVPGFAERRGRIVAALDAAAGDLRPIMPDALLDEVTALVEWPAVYAGTFDAAFLAVPQECLVLTMQQNQKYFALADASGRLANRFLLVSNLATTSPQAIVQGNERVLRARLADAKFFFDQDRRHTLASRLPRLAAIVYHNKLGSLAKRVERVAAIARTIAGHIGADPALAERAAQLAKADLVTDMVGEFPELQGLMGRYYAEHDRESASVSAAIEQHYWPRFAGDALPRDGVAQAVALADKVEALVGLFGVGAQPSGDKDPFGLRRAAIGVLRILIEQKLALPLSGLLGVALEAFRGMAGFGEAPVEVREFLYERLRGYLREQGYTALQVEAVLAQRPDRIDQVPALAAAVRTFSDLPEAQTLAAANKRIVNILRKSGAEAAGAVDRARLAEGAEHDLYLAFEKLTPVVDDRCASGDYTGALVALAAVKPVVDRFFDDVLVMADDPAVRANRLALLRGVAVTMNRVADISKLAVS